MNYWSLTPAQTRLLLAHTRRLCVHDLGSGDGSMARLIRRGGALEVTAVDKAHRGPRPRSRNIVQAACYFADYLPTAPAQLGVAVVSWPTNTPTRGLLELSQRAETLIYLGKNTDGRACGWPRLFADWSEREVLGYEPDPANDLIVYGPRRIPRPLLAEEVAALTPLELWGWKALHSGEITVGTLGPCLSSTPGADI